MFSIASQDIVNEVNKKEFEHIALLIMVEAQIV